MAGRSTAVDDREFHVVRKGYDRDEVRAYLGEVEVSFHQLERWAEDAKARLRVAEERDRRLYDVDEAMVAVFAAKDRVLDGGRLRWRHIALRKMRWKPKRFLKAIPRRQWHM